MFSIPFTMLVVSKDSFELSLLPALTKCNAINVASSSGKFIFSFSFISLTPHNATLYSSL